MDTLRRKSGETNLGLIQTTYFTTHFKVLSWGCLSKTTCSIIPSTDVVSVSGTGAVYRAQPAGRDGLVGALTGTISVDLIFCDTMNSVNRVVSLLLCR